MSAEDEQRPKGLSMKNEDPILLERVGVETDLSNNGEKSVERHQIRVENFPANGFYDLYCAYIPKQFATGINKYRETSGIQGSEQHVLPDISHPDLVRIVNNNSTLFENKPGYVRIAKMVFRRADIDGKVIDRMNHPDQKTVFEGVIPD